VNERSPGTGQDDLPRNAANYVPLSPLSFLARTAAVWPDVTAIIYGETQRTWRETYARCCQLASALAGIGVKKGTTVAVMLPNTPPMVELHFGVPMTGGVLNTLNTRLDAEALAFTLAHGEAHVLVCDTEFAPVVRQALSRIDVAKRPRVVDVIDPLSGAAERLSDLDYEAVVARGDPDHAWQLPSDEWDAIALNYTSGTTGNPKGVVYHHRGAYLNALSNIVDWSMPRHAVYLWTLPMFHCNGWCFPWTMAALGGTNICLRKVEAQAVLDAMRVHRVTHYCGAPIVHSLLLNAPEAQRVGITHKVSGLVAASAPPAAMIEGMEKLGFDITHVYGLTETYGPAAVCAKQPGWSALDIAGRAERNGRQGVAYTLQEALTVRDPATLEPVPPDGTTIGEIMFRGNITMKGYLRNPAATAQAFAGGWFHTGDLAVMQPDGYVKIRDRSKDVIISGGENISSLEVEEVLYRHPDVLGAAVVAQPDPKWGESPRAYVECKPGSSLTAELLAIHCRKHLAGFKMPKAFEFGELPKTSTGKIQKFLLRERARSAAAIE
jgi:fatty-acyl-CoA synthase